MMTEGSSTNHVALEGPWDVVVVGHGAAGLTAALAYLENVALQSNPRIAVLDRANVEGRGGSTAWTTANLRLDDDQALDPGWADVVRETSGHLVNDAYIEAFYENAVDTLNWLRRHGIKFLKVPAPIPLSFTKTLCLPAGGGRAIVDTLALAIADRGASIFYETTATRLVMDASGAVAGVVVRDSEGAQRVLTAPAVVLASGGFEANPEMLARYIPNAHSLKLVSPGTQANKGEGIRMAIEVGADTSGQFDRTHMEPVDPRSSNLEALVSSWLFGILVNQEGERFMDEAERSYDLQFDVVANRIFAEQNGRAYSIIDAGVRARVTMFDALNLSEHQPIRADSPEGLAEKLGIPGEALRRTIDDYNAACTDAKFDATRFDAKATVGLQPPKSHWAEPLVTPPFEAMPVEPHLCFTFGGLRVDGQSRVIGVDGRPIMGLYAAGEITGVFYDLYPSGTSVLRSLTFGRIAGCEVARARVTATAGGDADSVVPPVQNSRLIPEASAL
ncbi:FAD-dependent oxidoreductase [Mycobacterium sp. AZCC_0083]|uniref:FAD-dependent oxidoreductase n=1 Tax=Mycobacterium sp. AZCC_0083 TaxID=2735882 RepID=UPI00160D3FD1|nr:FAD-dependent oxidoreductase [Mycobacterium sp. AZCC_0083]MBB5164029.1 tricarballylate dehydrogenase [Mycobacterium sp. AZCC_0083]